MPALPRHAGVVALAAVAIGGGTLPGTAGWPQPYGTLEFLGLVVAAVLTGTFARQPAAASGCAVIRPSFVVDFVSLLLIGPVATMIVAATGAVAQWLAAPRRAYSCGRLVLNTATVVAATQAAGFAYRALGGTTVGHFEWPWQGLPVAAAVVAYSAVMNASSGVMVPLVTRQRVTGSWPSLVFRHLSLYFIGGGLAVALVEVIDHQAWGVLPIAAVPLYFGARIYSHYVNGVEDMHRRQAALESADRGVAVIDGTGRVTLWNEALERTLGCPRKRALGRSLVRALPALDKTDLPRALTEALDARSPRTLPRLGLTSAAGPRVFQVTIVPDAVGATVLWDDVTERARAEHGLKRRGERLMLAAEGAADGLWEWDLRTQEFYCSPRMLEMIGLAAPDEIGRPERWLDRVHGDDIASLKEALDRYLKGETDQFQHEHRIRHEDGTWRWFLCRGAAIRGTGGRPVRIGGSFTDITERSVAQERLRTAGFEDPLTGLGNRAVFVERLGRRLGEMKKRRADGWFAVLYLDLDRFKVVNDSLGHLVGDELLKAVSRRLESCLRPGDTIARLGGDEFAILLNSLGDVQQANAIAFRIQTALSAPFSIDGREVFTSASIGIAFSLSHYTSPDELMRDADTAMYHAKAGGRARHELFDADMHERARNRLGIESDLRRAVNSNEFELNYQPIVFLASGRCVGFESLVRWSRNGKAVSPATFIPIAEELGLIEPIGTWVLQQACRTFADWHRRFPAVGLDCITVNVSSRQLMQQNFLSIVEQAVRKAGLKPSHLRLEITETALLESPNVAAMMLQELRELGVKIYLDDFGTGYSSLSHLHKLPVDALKIDRSFVTSLQAANRPAIVESILALARTLNTSVVAEGIESEGQARELERLGCTHAQGFFFSRPLSTQAAEELLEANKPLGPAHAGPWDPSDMTRSQPERPAAATLCAWPEHVAAGSPPFQSPTSHEATRLHKSLQ